MPKVKKTVSAEQARADYLKLRRDSSRAEVSVPYFTDENPLLDDVPGDFPNMLPRIYQGRPLKLFLDAFDIVSNPGVDGFAQLTWMGLAAGQRRDYTTPIPPGDFPFELELPPGYTSTAGDFTLSCEVNTGGNVVRPPMPTVIHIDRLAPNNGAGGEDVVLPPEVEGAGAITLEYLNGAPGYVLVTVPGDYTDAKINDEVELFYGTAVGQAEAVGTFVRTDLALPITFQLTRSIIFEEGGGEKIIYYKLSDRSGNVGFDSKYKHIEVILTEAPTGLQAPLVPLHADGLIDLADFYLGVTVQLQSYTTPLPNDKFRANWDGTDLPDVDITGIPTFSLSVPYSILEGGNAGVKTVPVTYSIVREGKPYRYYPPIDITVDLRTPGPNPGTDPENPDLELVTVQAQVTPVPNEIGIPDIGLSADASVRIYDNYKADDIVQLYWQGEAVPGDPDDTTVDGVYKVTGLEPITFDIPFSIPWTTIADAGNNSALPVHYTIAHDLNDNVNTSYAQSVNVFILQKTIPNPLFLHLDPNFGYLNCQSIRDVTGRGWVATIQVAGGEPQLADQELTFTYQGWSDAAGTVEIPGTQATFTFTPTTEEAANGFIAYLDYEPLRLTRDGWGSITYSAVIDGFPIPATRHLVRVYMAVAGDGAPTCEVIGP